MSAIEPLCRLIGINPGKLTKEENLLLELEFFACIHEELMEFFREQHREYFRLMKFTEEKENTMIETKLAHLIIQDILSTGEYTLEGIAHYTNTHEDVIQEVYTGLNLNPSATLLRKIIDLHRTVRRDLYCEITKKIALQHLTMI
jgi:hypothetical protein